MKTFTKHLLLDFVIVFGNIFLSHGIIWLGNTAVMFFQGIVERPLEMEHLTMILMCVLPIIINILLYKTLLKKVFLPAEHKKPALYVLLPVIPYIIWTVVFFVLEHAGYPFGIEPYIKLLNSFLPLILITVIPVTIAYCLYFRKYVGEAYYVYVLSFFGVTVIPVTILLCAMTLG